MENNKKRPRTITKEMADEIKYSTLSAKKLAEKYNISLSHVYKIKRGIHW